MTSSSSPPNLHPIATFDSKTDADRAQHMLEEAGFPSEQLSVQAQPVEPLSPIGSTEAKRSGIGGAYAGGLLGSIVGLLFGLLTRTADQQAGLAPAINLGVAILVGTIVGAAGIGLIAVLMGRSAPAKTENGQTAKTRYRLFLQGDLNAVPSAAQTLRDRGLQV